MNKRRYGISMVIAVILSLVMVLPTFAQNASEEAVSDAIKVYVDGVLLIPADDSPKATEPLLHDGTVYLPVWALSQALGKPVEWDSGTNSVYIGEPAEIAEITVSTAEEFLSALGSNRRILLEEGVYNLTAVDSGYINANAYSSERPDGPELFLDGVHNLTIQGVGDQQSEIVVEPRYANVLNFRNSSNISIVNIKAGHTEDGVCSGGVFFFDNCAGIQIEDTHMYGCGTIGLNFNQVTSATITGSTIYGCTTGIMGMYGSSDILFKDCVFRDNTGDFMISAEHSSGLTFDSCSFLSNTEASTMFYAASCENVVVKNTAFVDNGAQTLAERGRVAFDASNRFENNMFDE